jgi:hypothetical protein
MILDVPKIQNANSQNSYLTSLSVICRGSIRFALCPTGHLRIKTDTPQPWFSIYGIDSWADEEGFTSSSRNFMTDEIGDVQALLHKRLLVPKSSITIESSCPGKPYKTECATPMRAEAEMILHLPRMIIFYISQRDGTSYHSSLMMHFPSIINTGDSEKALEYRLDAKVYSTEADGSHFHAKILRHFGDLSGIYAYDDLVKMGKASLVSENPMDLSENEKLVVMAIYNLVSSEDVYMEYSQERTGTYD